jgi:hypothetical protein
MGAMAGADEDGLLDMAFRHNDVGRRGLIKRFLKIIPRANCCCGKCQTPR